MSAPVINAGQYARQNADWAARLIPGAGAPPREGGPESGKKRPQSVKAWTGLASGWTGPHTGSVRNAVTGETRFAVLIPALLKRRTAGSWLKSIAADVGWIALDWAIVAMLTLPLHAVLPRALIFQHPFGASALQNLAGLALLHAALITLIAFSEDVYKRSPTGVPAYALGRSILWATAVLALTYRLQGAPLRLVALICAAGVVHLLVLPSTWRSRPNRRTAAEARNVLIVGAGGLGRRLAAHLESNPEERRVVRGFLDDDRPAGKGVLGPVSELARFARMSFVDEVILAAPTDRDRTLFVLREARRLRLDVHLVPEVFGCDLQDRDVERIGNLPAICLHAEHLPELGLLLKRAGDIVGAGMLLFLITPLLALIALLVKLDTDGPMIFSAPRAGRKGRVFRCYKFRTMVLNAEVLKEGLRIRNQRLGPMFKISGDPRITRAGRVLRRYSLDELPQLWNVLKGEMSLVGPRPHPMDDYASYEVEHLARLDVTPGITGLWQVTARRDPSFQKSMELDREYIRRWSLGMDLRILFKTFGALMQGSGD